MRLRGPSGSTGTRPASFQASLPGTVLMPSIVPPSARRREGSGVDAVDDQRAAAARTVPCGATTTTAPARASSARPNRSGVSVCSVSSG